MYTPSRNNMIELDIEFQRIAEMLDQCDRAGLRCPSPAGPRSWAGRQAPRWYESRVALGDFPTLKSIARGKNVDLREVCADDAGFILALRTDPKLSANLSPTPADVEQQRAFIAHALQDPDTYYFLITGKHGQPLGTIRIYDLKPDSFCWGSWIISPQAPLTAAIESALLIYDFGFFCLHFHRAHFDVRKGNRKVIDFHLRFGARIVSEDGQSFSFDIGIADYLSARKKYARFLP